MRTKDSGQQPGVWPAVGHRSYLEGPALASQPWEACTTAKAGPCMATPLLPTPWNPDVATTAAATSTRKRFFFFRFYLFIFRERVREGEKHQCDRETSIGCLFHVPHPGTEPTTQAYALTRNRSGEFCFAGRCPTNQVIPFGARKSFFKEFPRRSLLWSPGWCTSLAEPRSHVQAQQMKEAGRQVPSTCSLSSER